MSEKDKETEKEITAKENEEEKTDFFEVLSELKEKLNQAETDEERAVLQARIKAFTASFNGNIVKLLTERYSQQYSDYKFTPGGKMPVVPVRGTVFFPESIIHFEISRKEIKEAVRFAMTRGQHIFAVTQKMPLDVDPDSDLFYETGTVLKVVQIINSSHEKEIKVIAEGVRRGIAVNYIKERNHHVAEIINADYVNDPVTFEQQAYVNLIRGKFKEYAQLSPKYPKDIYEKIRFTDNPSELADFAAAHISLDYTSKQKILEELDITHRLKVVLTLLNRETEVLRLERKIAERAHEHMEDHQKEYFLREQIHAIKEELGEYDDEEEMLALKEKIELLEVDETVKEQLLKEWSKLYRMPESSQESYVLRSYLEVCLELPWNKSSKEKIDIPAVAKVLDKHHYGLEKVKERMLEYLSVRKLTKDVKGQILCLVGPPGVGKTSIAQSIAKAINRKAERVALGGVHDEAEIRGHRRTYIGSMPGRIINAIKSAGTNNPLIILDEIDKLAADYKGDPTSALLEVLDPEQNSTFRDHYIDLPFDLSKIMFITTANDASMIPGPLKDRMEVIEIGSYTREEKFNIAKKHLIPKQLKNNGLTSSDCKFNQAAIYTIIDGYTREAGVRNLERTIASVMRKIAKKIAVGERENPFKIDSGRVEELLGPVKFRDEALSSKNEVGLVNGLAWTSVGGETLPIEVAAVQGTGKIELTGSLGDVMKESAKIAVTCVRTRAEKLGIDPEFYKKLDIHLHAPEGAVPKDGPSAGITMTTAIVSALTEKPVNRFVAMTGEITLRGKVLPIGGLKEKAMGAYKMGIKTVVIPKNNEPDIHEIDQAVKDKINFIPVEYIDEVLEIAFDLGTKYEKPAEAKSSAAAKKKSKKSAETVSDMNSDTASV